MRLLRRDFAKDSSGSVKLIPEEPEDLWHVYNLIAVDDRISAVTVRKVNRETSSGGSEAERISLTLEIQVEAIDYDNVAAVLHVRGKNLAENEHVRLGAYHTLEIDQQRPFVLTKLLVLFQEPSVVKGKEQPTKGCPDEGPGATADVAAVILQEGLANICLLGGSVTTLKARIETSIPRKRGAALAGYDKALNKFFENLLQGVLCHVDFSIVKCLIIASPGFTKDQFYKYMMLEASRRELQQLIKNKSKIVLAHCSSGHKHSLKEVLAEPAVMAQIKDTRAAKEVRDPLRRGLDPEGFVADVVNSVNDLTMDGFNSMEEFAAQTLNLKSEEARQALKEGVDSIYNKVQDNIDESLTRWESICKEHYFNFPAEWQTTSSSKNKDVKKSLSKASCAEDVQEEPLDTELSSLRRQLIAAHRAGAKMRRELTSLEKQLALRKEVLSDVKSFEESCDGHVLEGPSQQLPATKCLLVI